MQICASCKFSGNEDWDLGHCRGRLGSQKEGLWACHVHLFTMKGLSGIYCHSTVHGVSEETRMQETQTPPVLCALLLLFPTCQPQAFILQTLFRLPCCRSRSGSTRGSPVRSGSPRLKPRSRTRTRSSSRSRSPRKSDSRKRSPSPTRSNSHSKSRSPTRNKRRSRSRIRSRSRSQSAVRRRSGDGGGAAARKISKSRSRSRSRSPARKRTRTGTSSRRSHSRSRSRSPPSRYRRQSRSPPARYRSLVGQREIEGRRWPVVKRWVSRSRSPTRWRRSRWV